MEWTRNERCGLCVPLVVIRFHSNPAEIHNSTKSSPRALFCSGLSENDSSADYRRDVLSGISGLKRDESHGFMVMSEQVKLMARCLESDRPWRELTIAYPELARTTVELAARPSAPGQEDIAAGYVDLFRTHVHEWNKFASEVATAGQEI